MVAPLFVYGEAPRLRHKARVLRRRFKRDEGLCGVFNQSADRFTQTSLWGTAGRHGDVRKLRREIGGHLHTRSNLSSVGAGAYTTLWSSGGLCAGWGHPRSPVPGRIAPVLHHSKLLKMSSFSISRFQNGHRGHFGYLNA